MESTDEIMHKKMQLAREAEAKDIARKHQREIAKKKFDPNFKDPTSISSATQEGAATKANDDPFAQASSENQTVTPLSMMHSGESPAVVPQRKVPGKAMQLGKPKKQAQQISEPSKDDFLAKPAASKAVKEEEAKAPVAHNPLAENVQVEVEEKVSCLVNMDGEPEKFSVQGAIFLTVNDPKKNKPCIQV